MSEQYAIFLINLMQDVNIIRPLIFMAARDVELRTEIFLTPQFLKRDKSGIWQRELEEISAATDTPVFILSKEKEISAFLQRKTGILVAASESNLSAHAPTHNIFRLAPASFVKVTLQHGFECVGFRQSHDHNLAHGRNVSFAADVIFGWYDRSMLPSILPSQQSKLYVSGPSTVLQMRPPTTLGHAGETGLVCENLHSTRLNLSGDFKTDFIEIFQGFCGALAERNQTVTLRPHPGGQYALKNNLPLPENVKLNNHPIYKVDLTRFAYGISAPSSVLIDMILAGIPVAVWRDGTGIMDTGQYDGLTEISSLSDWLVFSHEAITKKKKFLELQQRFLERQMMPTDPQEVYQNFVSFFRAAKTLPRTVC